MKISKVKLLGVVMAAMLLVVAAVGCAQSDTENGDTENTEQTSEALEGNITRDTGTGTLSHPIERIKQNTSHA
jgi:ABC-type Fe3+-citrate transport system substrate-binding protein